MVSPESGALQVILTDVIFLASLVGTAYFTPWRTAITNFTEVVTTVGLSIFMQVATFFIEDIGDIGDGKTVLAGVSPLAVPRISCSSQIVWIQCPYPVSGPFGVPPIFMFLSISNFRSGRLGHIQIYMLISPQRAYPVFLPHPRHTWLAKVP